MMLEAEWMTGVIGSEGSIDRMDGQVTDIADLP